MRLTNPPAYGASEELSAFGTDPLPNVEDVFTEVKAITEHWRAQGIEVGSDAALDIDY